MNKIDAYIESKTNSEQTDYNMYFKYNGNDTVLLNRHPEKYQFAKLFKACLIQNDIPGFVFTDQYGQVVPQNNIDAVLSSIHGINNISIYALRNIINACEMWDVEADLVVHLNNEEYKLVSDEDEINYVSSPASGSFKGHSDYVLKNLINSLENVKTEIKTENKQI